MYPMSHFYGPYHKEIKCAKSPKEKAKKIKRLTIEILVAKNIGGGEGVLVPQLT